jgi:hypothetical protein
MRTGPATPLAGLLALMALMGCHNATEPRGTDGDIRQSMESDESGGYGATVLPDGMLSGKTFMVVADNGGIFGSVLDGSGTDRAVKWTVDASGNVTSPVLLGSLPDPFDRADQYVRSASRNGDIVLGYAEEDRATADWETAGWVWLDGAMTMLPAPSTHRVYPHATNDAGVIVGQIWTTVDDVAGDWGAVWLPPYDAEPILLPRMQGYSLNSARGITNEGIITGWVRDSDMIDLVVAWQIDGEGNVLIGPLKIEGSERILANAVNQDREVVGSSHRNDQWEPTLFRSTTGQYVGLGWLGGRNSGSALGVNDRSPDGSVQAVGRSWTQGTSDDRAVLWSVNADDTVAGPVDLGLPSATVTRTRPLRTAQFVSASASSINSQGWVVGWSEREDRTFFATLWQPNQNGGDDDCKRHPRTGECR